MTEFKIPELGENVASGDVTRVLVSVGDTLARDQPVLELETDKATIEVPSSVAGVVRDIKVKAGDTVSVGAVVLTVESDGAANGPPVRGTSGADAAGSEAPGGPRDEAEAPAAAEPPASDEEPRKEAPESKDGQPQKVVSMPPRPAPEAPSRGAAPAAQGPVVAASPAVRRLAREIGVAVHDVQGSGAGGRITQEDVKEHARRILSSVGAAGGQAVRGGRPLPDFEQWGPVERQPWSNIRRTTAQHLSHAWATVPHVTQFDKADVTELDALRRTYRDQVASAGGALTVTAMLVRVLAAGVGRFPQFNASIDPDRGEIIYKQHVHVGVAVDTDRGLLVPVIRDADRKNITQIAVELQQLAERARDRKLTREEMRGGGITISNLGGIGGTAFTPIVNWPEVAILGVSRAAQEPVWRDEAFEPRLMLPLSLSYDHRVIDGADAMRFLRWVVEAIEQPFLLSLVG